MAAGYTKDFLLDAFLSRYYSLSEEKFAELEIMANRFYNEVGKDKFRVYCSLDAEALRKYREMYV
jgi:hypothetical protein